MDALGPSSTTAQIRMGLERLQAGEDDAREALIEFAYHRLQHIAGNMLRKFPSVRRWEMTDDVVQTAATKLFTALREVHPDSVRGFFGLAATQMRRVLTDMWRHHYGPQRPGAHYMTAAGTGSSSHVHRREEMKPARDDGPETAAEKAEFHSIIGELPEEHREVFDLLYYAGLSQEEAAEVLEVSVRTVKRRWRNAKLCLYELLRGQAPGSW